MKKEVSCKILQTYFLACKKSEISLDKIIYNIPYSQEYLTNKYERIEWENFLKIIENLRTYFDISEFENFGRLHTTPGYYPEGILAGLIFFSSNKFSRSLAKRVFKIGDMMISCMKNEIEFPGKDNIIVKLYLDDNYQPCPEFFISIKGYWAELGKLVGHKNFRINFNLLGQGATYNISWEKEGLLFNIRKRLRWLFNIRRAFADLTEAHDKLIKQYNELEESKRILQKQTTQLKTVHNISKSIRQNLDIQKTIKEIANTLVKDAEFLFAKVKLSKDIEGNKFEIGAISGKKNRSSKTIIKSIEIAENKIGELLIQPKITADVLDTEELLNYLLPVINISIHDALVLRTITDYKNNLETKVESRTSELINTKENLSRTIQLLREAQQTQSRFFANISHEFRTPLTLILGYIKNLINDNHKNSPQKNYILVIDNAKRLLDMVNKLLDLSKASSGSMKLRVSKVNATDVIKGILNQYQSLADSRKIDLKYISKGDNFQGYIDSDKIQKVVNNLLSNAFKFTDEEGTITLNITVTGKKAKFISFSITDTGIGIPEDQHEKIFERYYQVEQKNNRVSKGSGIGLALTKEIVKLHHGKIFVKSSPGKGSKFEVVIPIGKEEYNSDEIVNTKRIGESEADKIYVEQQLVNADIDTTTNDSEKPIVLIAEDDTEVRTFIRDNLQSEFQILEADNGKSGFEKGVSTIPDLIISDIVMPIMDGIKFCEKIKTDERTCHIPVILLTGRASGNDKIEGLKIGADDYLIKPFEADELKVRCANLIHMRRKLRKRFSHEITLQPKDITVTSTDERFLNKIIDIIENEISNQEFSVESLSLQAGLSRVQLYRKIHALTDLTVTEFIRTIRLKRAKSLIEQKFGNISEIALEVGFNNPAYFSECFKKKFGLLPSQLK